MLKCYPTCAVKIKIWFSKNSLECTSNCADLRFSRHLWVYPTRPNQRSIGKHSYPLNGISTISTSREGAWLDYRATDPSDWRRHFIRDSNIFRKLARYSFCPPVTSRFRAHTHFKPLNRFSPFSKFHVPYESELQIVRVNCPYSHCSRHSPH